jgi:lipopolysaccharide/colanic/teichoic acid biosynthesis glycosyltransferase
LAWEAVGLCERLASVTLLTALAPVLLPCAALLWLLSGRSPLIAHRRVGWHGQALWMIKLRTMWDPRSGNAPVAIRWIEYIEDTVGPRHKRSDDPRVISEFARFCRRHSIDELPQLWHVMRGEMSLVGPRPITEAEIERYYGADADEVLRMKPGIAGLWQVSGRNLLTYSDRRALDLELVRRYSVRLYLEVLLRTIPEVLSGVNSW